MPLSNVDSLHWFLPELILGGGVLLILLVDMLQRGSSRRVASFLTLAILGAAAAAVFVTSDGESRGLFGGLIARDPFADFWKYIFIAATALVGIVATKSKETIDYTDGDREAGEFYALAVSVCLGLFLMGASTDMLTAYISLEMVSILSFVLAGYKRRDRKSAEAALKYAIYGGVASGVMLYGMSLLYGMAGATSLVAIREVILVSEFPNTVLIAVVMTMAGFGYKIASVPFHMWCPDVYEGAPTPVTAFLSVAPKAAGFALLMRFFGGALMDLDAVAFSDSTWPVLLGVIAVFTMTVGNFVAIVQDNLKRMLAYSSIAHAGYLLLGLATMSATGHQAIMFYLVTYLFMNLGAFGVIIALSERGVGERISDYNGLGYRAPFVGFAMALFLFSLTGLPPTAGFAGKFLLFSSLIETKNTFMVGLALIGVANSAVSLFYYMRVLRAMYFEQPAEGGTVGIAKRHTLVLGVTLVPVLVLGLFWGPLQDWARASFSLWLK